MEALGINIGYLLMQIAGITILIVLLNTFAYKPILRVMEERKERIAKGLEDARQAAIARDNADKEAEKVLEAARAEANTIRQDAAKQAEEQAAGIVAKANENAKAIVAKAEAEAEEERNNVLADLRTQVASISIAAANKIVGETLDEKKQREIIGNFFAKVPANVSSLSGSTAEITSALPLTDSEKAAAEKAVKADKVTFKVNPSIMGGVIVRIDDQVVDNSVAGQMAGLREAMG